MTGGPIRADVVIAGAGLSGLCQALALASAGIDCLLVDRQLPEARQAPSADGRTTAIGLAGRRMLEALGVWPALAGEACPILDIRVSDGDSRLFLHYDHRAAGDEPMGHIVENHRFFAALIAALRASPSIRVLAPARIETADADDAGIQIGLAGGGGIRAGLLVACDGRDSLLRRRAGIRVTRWAYPQTALVCTVRHPRPHNHVAHERFLPHGPLALLPMRGDRCSVVWTESHARATALAALDDRRFGAELTARFGGSLGPLAITGGRWRYPLSLTHADSCIGRRLAVVGDAAHAIHPIAGQGFNLALRDAAALAELVADAMRLGLDPGGATVLRRYRRWRRFDVTAMVMATDGLNRLFASDLAPVRLARRLGLGMVNRSAPLKRLFMRQAMGVMGDLPRLLEGDPV